MTKKNSSITVARLHLYIQPGAKKPGFKGLHGDRLKIALAAPPVDGQANQALVDFLAEVLSVSKSSITIISGQLSRNKTVQIIGMPQSEIRRRLDATL